MSERDLWCNVMNQAIADATHRPRPKPPSDYALQLAARNLVVRKNDNRRPSAYEWQRRADYFLEHDRNAVVQHAKKRAIHEQIRIRDTARRWLTKNSDDFRRVCTLAGMEPEAVRDRMLGLARRNWELPDIMKSKLRGYIDG